MKSVNISIEESKRIFESENTIFKTVLESSPPFTEHRPFIIALIKEGTKYLHGITCYKDSMGKIEPNCWVASFDKSNTKVFDGQRWDLVDAYRDYERQLHDYRNTREKYYHHTWYDCEAKAREEHGKNPFQGETT